MDIRLGARIRERRQALKLSLRELADQVDLTPSFLSQIERDLASPSIESLRKICEALESRIFDFVVESEVKNPVVHRNERLKLILPNSSLTYELLTPDLNRSMDVFMATLEPGDENIAMPLRQQTEECIIVLQGQLEIQLGEKVHLLKPGDSLYFQGALLRRLTAKGDTTLRFISAITPSIF